ncbi:hypothetical protein AAW14_27875 [Streptomyces hygroscopicus]|uniref:PucR family transcriptional regulator n=1 Tax=Streptomyces hygroscopicus TaxID=1912 RepID=UPI0022407BAA|nr:helix-turn-helix domain-containing protein [Streptomyces hygroscopicus]MCW7945720.1 hypothetical protein [Streptomyces hygroscopicus]
MATVDDVVCALEGQAELVVPPPAGVSLSGAAPWEPGRKHEARGLLLGVGVPGADVLAQDCAGVVLREPPDPETRGAWELTARQRGIALVLLKVSASWSAVIRACAQISSEPGGEPAPAGADATGEVPQGDLFALADAFADMVGGPTIIEDANFRVLAYSSFTGAMDQGRNTAILGRRMPPEWLAYLEQTGDLERLRTTSDVVDLPSGPGQAHRRLITAVRDSQQLLGVLWAAEGDQPLPGTAPQALRRAADIAVPHLLRHLEGHRAERIRRDNLVRALLDGRGLLHRHATELGLPHGAAFGVMAVAPSSQQVLPDEVWDRITDHVALSCEAFRWHAAVARVGELVFAILALPANQPEEGMLRLGREIVNRSVPVLRDRLCGAVSTIGPQLGRLNQRRQEAEDAVGVVRSAPDDDRFATYDDVLPQVILHELRQMLAQREQLRLPGLLRLAEEDSRRASDFIQTLRCYLSFGAQPAPTARELGIHVTTLRYRLGRIRDISGLDLDDPAVRLVCNVLIDLAPCA